MNTRVAAHSALMGRIQGHTQAGATAPCITHPVNAWTSDEVPEQRTVAPLCAQCPALAACTTYLTKYGERAGVWAGTTTADRYANTGKPKPKEQP